MKKQFTNAEKIKYFEAKIAKLKELPGDEYQDWSGRVSTQIADAKVAKLVEELLAAKLALMNSSK